MRDHGCQAKRLGFIHTLFILICILSYAAIHTHSHMCPQLSPPYTVLKVHIYIFFSLQFLSYKESRTSPNRSNKIFPFLQTSPQADISNYVSTCWHWVGNMSQNWATLRGPAGTRTNSVGSWSHFNLNCLAKSLQFHFYTHTSAGAIPGNQQSLLPLPLAHEAGN